MNCTREPIKLVYTKYKNVKKCKKTCTEIFFYKKTKEETWNFERVADEHTVKKWCKKNASLKL